MGENGNKRLLKRKRAEIRFQWIGRFAIFASGCALLILLTTILSTGTTAFFRTKMLVDVQLDKEAIGITSASREQVLQGDYYSITKQAIYNLFPAVTDRSDRRDLSSMLSSGAPDEVRDYLLENPSSLGKVASLWLTAESNLDQLHKGNIKKELDEVHRGISNRVVSWYDFLLREGRIKSFFNIGFLSSGDSRNPEQAGVWGAIVGSFYSLLVCFLISFPMGIAAAIYLEEFAPKNRITEIIEVNINNLAAVPSIIFGLLGLAILLNTFELPRSTPLVGGIVLALMTLPTIIIACRASLKAVPDSIRQGAMAMGASKTQAIFHHVLPLAMPGTLTGTIIGLAQALGETAPLLMIGMVAFIVDVPKSPMEPSASLPVQIYLWAESAERGFVEKTSAAIMVILAFLLLMNAAAVFLRTRFERRW
ncbi:MAG: phosphate ABC transporter permease PstA [Bdellovibrionales bacterium]|nr:phosphate ABC transporter permease PstA [Bdellovibrionales bacterium]